MAFSERVTRLKSSLIRDILAAAQRPEVMSFAGGLPAERCLPEVDWSGLPASLGQYGMSEGEPALREAIAAQARAYGLECTAEQVLVTTGSQQALDLVAKLYLDVGTPVLLEGPTYLAALQSFQFFGADCLSVNLTPEGLDLDALRLSLQQHRPAFAYLIPTFQNPSGVRYSAANRAAVAALLDEFGVTLRRRAGAAPVRPVATQRLDPYRYAVQDPAAGVARGLSDCLARVAAAVARAQAGSRSAYLPHQPVAGAAMAG